MKKNLLTLLLAITSLMAVATETPKYLVVWAKNGSMATYALKDNPQVTFAESIVAVNNDGQETSFLVEEMQCFTYESVMPGDVNGDDKVDIVDVTKTISHLISFTRSDFPEYAADINRDGVVNSEDVTVMLDIVVNGQNTIKPVSDQQPTGEAFYIYRSDGQFNAFFRDEVEKMEYSNYDADGNPHDEVVSQLVRTTDSVYCIPLAAIDSVGFVKPDVVFNSAVVKLEDLLPYVVSVDGLTINFDGNMPSNLIPHLENVLFFGGFEDPFPNGFAGIIKQVNQGDDIVITCEPASIEDIYDQLVDCQIFEMDVPAGSRMAAAGDYNPNREGLHIPLEADGVLRSHNVNYKGDLYVRVFGRFVPHRQLGQPTNVDISLTLENTCDVEISFMEGVKFDHDFNDLITPIPIRLPYGFSAIATVKPFIEVEIGEKLTAKYTYYNSQTFGLRYENGVFNTYRIPYSEFTGQDVSLQGRASFYGGIKGELRLCTAGNLAQVGGALKVGLFAEGEIGLGSTAIDNTDNYEFSKNDRVTTSLRVATEVSAGLYAGSFAKFEVKLPLANWDFLRFDHYVLPLFQEPTYTRLNNSTDVEVTLPVERDLLGNVEVGLSLYDESDNLIETKYEERPYRVEADFTDDPVKLTFSNVDVAKVYTVYPIVRLFGEDIYAYRATPCKQIGAPIIVNQIDAVGKCGGELKFKAIVSPKEPFEEDEGITGRGFAVYYQDQLMKECPIDISSPNQSVEIEFVCHSDSLVEDWEQFIASTNTLWYITTYYDDAEGNRTYLTDELQDLNLVYDQKPAKEYSTISFNRREERTSQYVAENGDAASFQYYKYWWDYEEIYYQGTYWWEYEAYVVQSVKNGTYYNGGKDDSTDRIQKDGYCSVGYGPSCSYEEGIGFYDWFWPWENIIMYSEITLRNDEIVYSNNATQITGDGEETPEVNLIDMESLARSNERRARETDIKEKRNTIFRFETSVMQ